MTKDEALKLALEALENLEHSNFKRRRLDALIAIKQALAQPDHGWTPERIAGMERLKDQQDAISPTCNLVIKTSNQRIEFNADDGFGAWLTNPTKTDNGLTVGERNRAALHGRLDAWMDDFKEKNT